MPQRWHADLAILVLGFIAMLAQGYSIKLTNSRLYNAYISYKAGRRTCVCVCHGCFSIFNLRREGCPGKTCQEITKAILSKMLQQQKHNFDLGKYSFELFALSAECNEG